MSATALPTEPIAIDGIGGAAMLGTFVRHLRWREGAGQHAMATRLGFHCNYLGAVERGESRNPTLATVVRLAFGFDVSIGPLAAAFVTWDETNRPLPRSGERARGTEPVRDPIALGSAIAFLRRRAGSTQIEFAQRTGLHRSYLGALEKGGLTPGLITVTRVASGLLADQESRDALAAAVAELAKVYAGEIDLQDLTAVQIARAPEQ